VPRLSQSGRLEWLARYIGERPPALLGAREDGTVFLDEGDAFDRVRLTTLVRGYTRKAKLGKRQVYVATHPGAHQKHAEEIAAALLEDDEEEEDL